MNIALLADRLCIPQALRDRSDSPHDVALRLRFRVPCFELLKRRGCQHRAGPGSEILRGEILLRNLAQVFVNIRLSDTVMLAPLIEILKQLLSGKILTAFDDSGKPSVRQIHRVLNPALAAECET